MEHITQQCMEFVTPFFDFLILILHGISILILLWGILIVVLDFIASERKIHDRFHLAQQNTFIKNCFGSYVLLSLEILIAADIIESIINPTFMDIARLASVVVIRTLISYFLNLEIKESMNVDYLSKAQSTVSQEEISK
ncbi:DUF1622 domain-containing protein [Enterococcus nangangensis]